MRCVQWTSKRTLFERGRALRSDRKVWVAAGSLEDHIRTSFFDDEPMCSSLVYKTLSCG